MAEDEIISQASQEIFGSGGAATAGVSGLLIFEIILWAIIGILLVWVIISFIRNKIIYKFPVVLYARRGNSRIIRYAKGGYINLKGLRTFRIKWGKIKLPWWKKDLEYLPDTALMDAEGRLHFDQYDPDTYIQKRITHLSKPTRMRVIEFLKPYEMFREGDRIVQFQHLADGLVDLEIAKYLDDGKESRIVEVEESYFEPVPRNTKQIAIQNIRGLEETLKSDKFKQMALLVGGIIVLALVFLGAYMILTAS